MPDLNPLVLGFLVALGIGLLIGIDRERNKGDGPSREAAGLRTFTLASLTGAIGMAAGGELLLGAAVLGVVALTGLAYWRARDGDPGLTTEVALVLTTLLGGFAIREPVVAAGLGVVVAALLNARSILHRISRSMLSDAEIKDLLIFAGATLVVLPLLPDEPVGPYGALNLRNIWIVVILVMAVSALGYVAMRVVGTRFGLPIAGLASGFISSTATIAAMGATCRQDSGGLPFRRRRRGAVDSGHHRAAGGGPGRDQPGDTRGALAPARRSRRRRPRSMAACSPCRR